MTYRELKNQYAEKSHAQDITKLANKLYDKIRRFIDEIKSLEIDLTRAHNNYNNVMFKLTKNLAKLLFNLTNFHQLSIEIKKPISINIAI